MRPARQMNSLGLALLLAALAVLPAGTVQAQGVLPSGAAQAQGVCKTKTAGYFKLFQQDARSGGAVPEGIARPLTSTPADPLRGQAISEDPVKGNCLACHKIPGLSISEPAASLGPSLDGIGARRTDAELRQILVNPAPFFPRTVMPAYFKISGLARVANGLGGRTILTPEEIEDVIAFLKTLR